ASGIGAQVDVHDAIPVRLRNVEQRSETFDAGVVEQHVEPSPALVGDLEHAADVRGACHVYLDGGLAELVGQGLGTLAVQVGQQQVGAVLRQSASRRGADATRGASDQDMDSSVSSGSIGHWTRASYRCRWRSAAAR